jgi:hypothetical protein
MRPARVFLLLLVGLMQFSLFSCSEDCISVTIKNYTYRTLEISGDLCFLDQFLNKELPPSSSKSFSVRNPAFITANGYGHIFTYANEIWEIGPYP